MTFDHLPAPRNEHEAARLWMAGRPRREVAAALGTQSDRSASDWARRRGLPARVRRAGSRPAGARHDVGRRIYNGKNFQKSA